MDHVEKNIVEAGRFLIMFFEPQIHHILGKQPEQERVSFPPDSLGPN